MKQSQKQAFPRVIGLEASSKQEALDPVRRRARRKTFFKPRNVVVYALARKLATYLWHALMEHPFPSEASQGYHTKLVKLATALGAPRLRKLGYKNSAAFIETLLERSAPVPAAIRAGRLRGAFWYSRLSANRKLPAACRVPQFRRGALRAQNR